MSDFALAFAHTMQFEDDPNQPGRVTHDAGGRTRFGIADKFHPDLPEEFFTGPAGEACARAEEIELEQYWKPLKLDRVEDQSVANKLFDMGVNMGVHQAAVLAQRAINFLIATAGAQAPPAETQEIGGAQPSSAATVQTSEAQAPSAPIVQTSGAQAPPPAERVIEDGIIGPRTLEQINRLDPAQILKALQGFSESHYRHIAAVNPEQAVNLDGWLRRAAA